MMNYRKVTSLAVGPRHFESVTFDFWPINILPKKIVAINWVSSNNGCDWMWISNFVEVYYILNFFKLFEL